MEELEASLCSQLMPSKINSHLASPFRNFKSIDIFEMLKSLFSKNNSLGTLWIDRTPVGLGDTAERTYLHAASSMPIALSGPAVYSKVSALFMPAA